MVSPLEADCEVVYKFSDIYAPGQDGGVRWDDPAFAYDGRLLAAFS